MSEQRNIPCRYCDNRIVTGYPAVWGVCAECRERLRNAQICEVCHHKLFLVCDWQKPGLFQTDNPHGSCTHKAGEKLNHYEWGVHICDHHMQQYKNIKYD